MSETTFGVFMGLLIGLFLTVTVGIIVFTHSRDEAVRTGHAEYYLDSDYHKQWRWKECK